MRGEEEFVYYPIQKGGMHLRSHITYITYPLTHTHPPMILKNFSLT